MRGEVTAALLHSPELLLLDEPTVGLDIVSKEALRSFLSAERAEAGTTILLTTHDLPDIERLSDRVVVVDGGRVVHTGNLSGLAAEAGVDRVLTVELTEPAGPLGDVPGTRLLSPAHDTVAIATGASTVMPATTQSAVRIRRGR